VREYSCQYRKSASADTRSSRASEKRDHFPLNFNKMLFSFVKKHLLNKTLALPHCLPQLSVTSIQQIFGNVGRIQGRFMESPQHEANVEMQRNDAFHDSKVFTFSFFRVIWPPDLPNYDVTDNSLLRPREQLRSIVMSMSDCGSVCLCVYLYVYLSVCPRGYLRNHTRDLYQFFVYVAYVCGSVALRHVYDRPHRLSPGRSFLPHWKCAQHGRSMLSTTA